MQGLAGFGKDFHYPFINWHGTLWHAKAGCGPLGAARCVWGEVWHGYLIMQYDVTELMEGDIISREQCEEIVGVSYESNQYSRHLVSCVSK